MGFGSRKESGRCKNVKIPPRRTSPTQFEAAPLHLRSYLSSFASMIIGDVWIFLASTLAFLRVTTQSV